MAITKLPPNCVHLGGPVTYENTIAASEAITPGMLIERFNNGGITRFRKSTRTGLQNSIYAVEQTMLNKGITDDYAANDLVEAIECGPGATIYAIIASGANIAFGARLTDAGNGKLKAVGSDIACAEAIENVNNSAGPGDARIRVTVV
jgi:hypothetical protein